MIPNAALLFPLLPLAPNPLRVFSATPTLFFRLCMVALPFACEPHPPACTRASL
jgi:hypothetical protein